jgi:hypothetical protein
MSLPPSVTLSGTNPVISHVSGRVSYANGTANGRWNSTDSGDHVIIVVLRIPQLGAWW